MVPPTHDAINGTVVPLIELKGVSKTFGGVTALQGVDFSVLPGELHGLVGENGAGKSTLMKIIAGLHTGYEGEMRVEGRVVQFRSARDAIAAGIGMVHQELSVVPDLSVAENVFLGVQPVKAGGIIDWSGMKQQARALIGSLGVDIDPSTRVGTLPVGVQQLIELSRVLFSGARTIILDEPTSALSPPEVARLFAACASSARKAGAWSSSRISSMMCSTSPTASPCSATAAASPRNRAPTSTRTRSSAT